MEVSKDELYYRERMGRATDAEAVNALVLEWVEGVLVDSSLASLSQAFVPYSEQVMDVIWLLSQEAANIEPLVPFLLHFLNSGDVAYLSRLAIERLDAEVLERAGVITQASALVKKMSRINTQLHYKYNKNLFMSGEEMKNVSVVLGEAVGSGDREKFFWTVGKWELDLHRALDILLFGDYGVNVKGLEFLLNNVLMPLPKLKEFLSHRLALLWRHNQLKSYREQVEATCRMGLHLIGKHGMTLEELEGMTWPKSVEESRKELEEWGKCVRTGVVMGEIGPFYEPMEEYYKMSFLKVKNQRIVLCELLQQSGQENEMLQQHSARMLQEETFIEYFLTPLNASGESSTVDGLNEEELMERISKNGPMPWLHDVLWQRICERPIAERFALYEQWDAQKAPILVYSRALSLSSVKRFLRRLSKDNVRQYCRLLGKVSHANPVTVLTALVEQVMAYDNLTAPVIESLRYLTTLEFDVLTFAVLGVLEKALRERRGIKEGTSVLAPWLVNLAGFSASLFKRYGNGLGELGQVVQKVFELMEEREDGFVLVVFVQELLREMAGIGSPEDVNDRLLVAKASAGPQLLKCLLAPASKKIASEEDGEDRSSKRLFTALRNTGLLFKMYGRIEQVRQRLLDGGADESCEWYHVKVIGEFADRMAWTMLQYGEFLFSHKHRLAIDELSSSESRGAYGEYLRRRIDNEDRSEYVGCLYEEEMGKLGDGANDKLKRRLLEDELAGIMTSVSANDMQVSIGEMVKRALVSVPDAWQMAHAVSEALHTVTSTADVVNVDDIGRCIGMIVPWLTPYEAHNFGKFLERVLNSEKSNGSAVVVEELEKMRVESSSNASSPLVTPAAAASTPILEDSNAALSTGQVMVMENSSSQAEVSQENSSIQPEASSSLAEEECDDEKMEEEHIEEEEMEEGEVDKQATASLLYTTFKALQDVAVGAIGESISGDEVYVRRRNFMIILWYVREFIVGYPAAGELAALVEGIREEEKREDLRVMASRVVTIFVSSAKPIIGAINDVKEEHGREKKQDKEREQRKRRRETEDKEVVEKKSRHYETSSTSRSERKEGERGERKEGERGERKEGDSSSSSHHHHYHSSSSREKREHHYPTSRYEDDYYRSSSHRSHYNGGGGSSSRNWRS